MTITRTAENHTVAIRTKATTTRRSGAMTETISNRSTMTSRTSSTTIEGSLKTMANLQITTINRTTSAQASLAITHLHRITHHKETTIMGKLETVSSVAIQVAQEETSMITDRATILWIRTTSSSQERWQRTNQAMSLTETRTKAIKQMQVALPRAHSTISTICSESTSLTSLSSTRSQ